MLRISILLPRRPVRIYVGGIAPREAQPKRSALIVDDDSSAVSCLHAILEERFECEVVHAPDAAAAERMLLETDVDLVITSLRVGDNSGLDLTRRLKSAHRETPIVVLDDEKQFSSAAAALNSGADALLTKPLEACNAATEIDRVLAQANHSPKVVLAIGAHPDDVELGCGGLLAKHSAAGDRVVIHTLTHGSRGGSRSQRARESQVAAGILGAELILSDLPDGEIPESARTVEVIEEVVGHLSPDHVYTHSLHDVHQDHRATHRAARVASRGVPVVSCFQAPSSTIDFSPTRFNDITKVIGMKVEAIRAFESQWVSRPYLDEETIRSTARYWGRYSNARYVEALEVLRLDEHLHAPLPSVNGRAEHLAKASVA